MLSLLSLLTHLPRSGLIYGLAGWSFALLVVWQVWAVVRDAMNQARRMHQIPCANCQFFTNDPLLKCPVHPRLAMSEQAIGCPDYQATGYQIDQDKTASNVDRSSRQIPVFK